MRLLLRIMNELLMQREIGNLWQLSSKDLYFDRQNMNSAAYGDHALSTKCQKETSNL